MRSHKHRLRSAAWMTAAGAAAFLYLGTWSASAAESDNEALLRTAAAAVEDGLYEEVDLAVETYLKKARSDDARAMGLILQARSFAGQGKYAEVLALQDDGRSKVKDPALKVGLLYWKARALYELDRLEEAAQVLEALPAQSESQWQAPAHFLHVRVARSQGRRDEAIEAMAVFDKVYPEDPDASINLFELGLLYLETDQREKAIETLRTLLIRFPDSTSALEGRLWLAREIYATGREEEALALLQALGANVDAPPPIRMEALRSLAQFREAAGAPEDALTALTAALELKPPAEEAARLKSMQAFILLNAGREQEAIAVMHDAVQGMGNRVAASRLQLAIADQLLQRKSYARAYDEYQRHLEVFTDEEGRGLAALGKAWSLFGLERYAEAAEYFEHAASGGIKEGVLQEAFIKLGDSWFASGHYDKALAAYQTFLTRFPQSPHAVNAQFQLSETLARLGRIDEAVVELSTIEKAAGKDMQVRLAAMRIAELRQRAGQFDLAVEAYNRILETYKDDESRAQAMIGRAAVRYNRGQFYEALEDLEQLGGEFAGTPYAEQAMAMSVWCQYLSGRDQEALQLAADFIETYPKSVVAPQIQFWKAEYRYNRDEFQDAEQLFVALAKAYPDHDLADDALFWAGRSAFERKEYRQAIAYDKALIEQYPESAKRAEARFAQGDSLSKLGEFSGAILAFEEIIRQFPDHYLVDEARGRIGDCHFTLGAQDPARYRDSLDAYVMILSRERATPEMIQQAQYKIGRCHEKLEDVDQALANYLKAVYGYLESVRNGEVVSSVWFSRAAFAAADLLEDADRLKEAANLYKRVVRAQVPAADDAQRRLLKLRREHWWIL